MTQERLEMRGRSKTKRFDLFSKQGLFINQNIAEKCIRLAGTILLQQYNGDPDLMKDSWQHIVEEIRADYPDVCVVYYYIRGDAVKVGITNNPSRRFGEFETASDIIGTPALCIPFISKTHAHGFEGLVHQGFKKYRRHGEWFDLYIDGADGKENHVEQLVGGLANQLLRVKGGNYGN